ncbi:iron chelate uptake ABC transporter family permease subunit [Corynebacterium anserum]|uniref:Iron chelate uptake ABC transporter family permease subunit n=1 Tax=Corynebacterium anserum TaxID=2684406 RepID=A0A7G7YR31_9CORY|nr:iron chelate uptake ABC transporter family permease subunit [Corynebacterium anserum]
MAFIGLIIPHLGRFLVGANHRVLLPISAVMRSTLLVCVDTLCRVIAHAIDQELPINVLTAFFGSPLLLLLLAMNRRSRERTWGHPDLTSLVFPPSSMAGQGHGTSIYMPDQGL